MMANEKNHSVRDVCHAIDAQALSAKLRDHFTARREVRRGVCLLNAGDLDAAERAFMRARDALPDEDRLPAFLAAAQMASGAAQDAAKTLTQPQDAEHVAVVDSIRQALALWRSNQRDQAVETLRRAIEQNAESGELHFQLGTLLTQQGRDDEAELRFTQAINIDPDHSRAAVSLALCCATRQAPEEALKHLKRAQAQRPHDAQIGLLLTQAAKATRQSGRMASVRALMPADNERLDRQAVEELARVIETDPDFVDALLSIPLSDVDSDVYAMLLSTLQLALQHQPEQAELHFHCSQVLTCLGRTEEAIHASERAVALNPRFTRALVGLGKLYQETDQADHAALRLEQAVRAGAEFADVHFLLGNLYRDRGETTRARQSYERALTLNDQYGAAREALEALATLSA